MKHTRIVVTRYGGPDVMRVVEEERPEPKAGEVRPRERMAELHSAADLFVLGSRREGSGYALIEALARAAPSPWSATSRPSGRWRAPWASSGRPATRKPARGRCWRRPRASGRPAGRRCGPSSIAS